MTDCRDDLLAKNDCTRPNFLLIMTDQQRADHLGAYGNPQVRTPHIDALAADGVVFDRFYVNAPVCMPNRAAILTGRMPSSAGVRMNGIPLPLSARSFAETLREAGYQTALVGKAHFQNMTNTEPTPVHRQPDVPRDRQADSDLRDGQEYGNESSRNWENPAFRVSLPYYGFDEATLCLEHGDQVGGDFARWLERQGFPAMNQRGSTPNSLSADESIVAPQAWRTALDATHYPTSFISRETIGWLRSYADAPEGQRPFMLLCSFPDPHHPFTPPEPYWSAYSPDDIRLPASFDASLEYAPPHKYALHKELSMGLRRTSGSRVIAVNEAEARQAIALNYGAISMIDDAVGDIMNSLRELNLLRNTVVVFMSDHGDLMGDHGLLFKGPLHYQSLIRMPFIWRDPRYEGQNGRRHSLACAMDIAPTIIERAGAKSCHGMQGRSLLPAIDNERDWIDGAILIEEENHRSVPGLPDPPRVRTLISDRWRLSVYLGTDWGELYDLSEDPHEIRNLFNEPANSGIRAELLWKLSQEMIKLSPNLPLATKMA
jgi:arylsulfatase A-like enzyme